MSILLLCFGLSFALAQLALTRLESITGSKKNLASTGLLVCAASTLLIPLASSFAALLTLRTLQGVAIAALVPGSIGLLLQKSPPGKAGASLGLLETLKSVGFGVGPIAGSALSYFCPLYVVYFVAALLMGIASFVLNGVEKGSEEPIAISARGQKTHHKPITFILSFGGFIAASSAVSVIVVQTEFSEKLGISTLELSLILSAMIFSRMVFSPAFGKASDTHGPLPVMILGMSILALATMGLGFCSTTPAAIFMRVIAGAGMAMFYTPCMLVASQAEADRAGIIHRVSLVSAGFALGAALGPLFTAAIAATFQIEMVFTLWGTLGALFVAVILSLEATKAFTNLTLTERLSVHNSSPPEKFSPKHQVLVS
jgi:MFS family permease